MIISDFTPIGKQGDTEFAEITVKGTSEKIKRHTIAKESKYWFFVETGKFVPGSIAEDLERAYYAQLKLKKLTN
jgi:hypothetical protein